MSFFNTDIIVTSTKGLQLKNIGVECNNVDNGKGSIYVNGTAIFFKYENGSAFNITSTSSSTLNALTDIKMDDSSNFENGLLLQTHTFGTAPLRGSLSGADINIGIGGYSENSTYFTESEHGETITYADSSTGTAVFLGTDTITSSVSKTISSSHLISINGKSFSITQSGTTITITNNSLFFTTAEHNQTITYEDLSTATATVVLPHDNLGRNIISSTVSKTINSSQNITLNSKKYAITQANYTITLQTAPKFVEDDHGETITYSDGATATATVSLATGEVGTHTLTASSSKVVSTPQNITLNGKTFSIIQSGTTVTLVSPYCILTEGKYNISIGSSSLINAIHCDRNIAIGSMAGMKVTTDNHENTLIGFEAGKNGCGDESIIFGYASGKSLVGDDNTNNIIIGNSSDTTGNNSGEVMIGYGITSVSPSNNSNIIVIGNDDITHLWISQDAGGTLFTGALNTSSDIRIKENIKDIDLGLTFVENLNPVSYNLRKPNDYDIDLKQKIDWFINGTQPRILNNKEQTKINYGFIAQEVDEVLKKSDSIIDKYNNNMIDIDEKTGMYSINYNSFIAPLVKSLQELTELSNQQNKQINIIKKLINK